jgi:hypothetical protein
VLKVFFYHFQEHKYYQRVFNAYHSSLYYDRNRYDGELGNASNPYFDPIIPGIDILNLRFGPKTFRTYF